MMHALLVAIIIMNAAGAWVPHALIQCAEIGRMVDETPYDPENPDEYISPTNVDADGLGAVLKTDSRGRMYFSTSYGDHHCAAWFKGYKRWEGILPVTDTDVKFTIVLEREP